MADRIGRQAPTRCFVLPYKKTDGGEAVRIYEKSGRTAMEWQKLLVYDMLARNDSGEWAHMKYGIAVPRQNGKNEAIAIRELYGLLHGERIMHTAHRTDTSHAAWERLVDILTDAKLIDPGQKDKGIYRANGKEHIYLDAFIPGGGRIEFRTRTSRGGLGTSYDTLVIDEAQEYQDDQEAALKYTVAASQNPQMIFCGTPPTTHSVGTVFAKMRKQVLAGEAENTGWSEWSVDQLSDPHDRGLWYEANPALGIRLTERTIANEIGGDDVDFNIQRLGLWLSYSQKSAISKKEWAECLVEKLPKLRGKLFIGIKYGHDGANVALSIAVKTTDERIFVEVIDCRPIRATNRWIMDFIRTADWAEVVIDGQNGQRVLADLMKQNHMRKPILPKVSDVIKASAEFEQAIFDKKIAHCGQPSLADLVSNCEHRAIGSNGGFGYSSIHPEREIALMDSVVLAHWAAAEAKEKKAKHNKVRY